MRTRYLLLALLALVPITAAAQTTVNSTTAASAISATTNTIALTSVTNVAAGDIVFIDREAMRITSTGTLVATAVNVARGSEGTAARAHAALAIAYTGPAARFYNREATSGSTCTATSELYTPRIVLPTGNIYSCVNSVWNQLGAEIGTVVAQFVQGGVVANAVDGTFFIADREYVITAIRAVWGTAESTGAMDIMVKKTTSTTACASGTSEQTAAIDATTTANTVATATLTTTAADRLLAAGNRLCVDLTSTPNEVSMMTVTVTLAPH